MDIEEINRLEREKIKQFLWKYQHVIYMCAISLLLLVVTATHLYFNRPPDVFEEIFHASMCKVEFCDESKKPLVRNSIFPLCNYLNSISLVPCDVPPEFDWVYKMTFDSGKVVVFVGKDYLTINGDGYTTPEGTTYYGIVEHLEYLFRQYAMGRL